jgi:hypothetical protein
LADKAEQTLEQYKENAALHESRSTRGLNRKNKEAATPIIEKPRLQSNKRSR